MSARAKGAARGKKASTGRRRPARKGSSAGARAAGRLRRIARGDRPYIALLVTVLLLVGAMAIGPLQQLTAAVERVDSLEVARDELRAEVDALEERRAKLSDPEELELLARSELGMVKPGEIPYVVVVPEADDAQVRPEVGEVAEPPAAPWHQRLWHAIRRLFTDDTAA